MEARNEERSTYQGSYQVRDRDQPVKRPLCDRGFKVPQDHSYGRSGCDISCEKGALAPVEREIAFAPKAYLRAKPRSFWPMPGLAAYMSLKPFFQRHRSRDLPCAFSPHPFAQQAKPWEQIPVPKLHDFKPHQPKRIELKNGIVLFLQEDHELPFVSASVLIPGGARDEDAAKTGLVGLYGQAWRTSGTAKLSGDALDDLLEAKAAHIETGGDVDSTALSWDSLKGDADQVFSLAMDLLFHPQIQRGEARTGAAADGHGHRAA